MPILHEKRNQKEMFIRTRCDRCFVTFQLTLEGQRFLSRGGHSEGSYVGQTLLKTLIENGWAYTNGSGAKPTRQRVLETVKSPSRLPSGFNSGDLTDRGSTKSPLGQRVKQIIGAGTAESEPPWYPVQSRGYYKISSGAAGQTDHRSRPRGERAALVSRPIQRISKFPVGQRVKQIIGAGTAKKASRPDIRGMQGYKIPRGSGSNRSSEPAQRRASRPDAPTENRSGNPRDILEPKSVHQDSRHNAVAAEYS